jgi:hypothetical protein
MTCPTCQESAKFIDYRHTTLTSLFGKVAYERAYYHCEKCGHGHCPADHELDVENRKTRAAEEVISLGAVTDAFKEAAEKVLAKMSGLRVSKSTVHRTAEEVGDKLARQKAAGETISPKKLWNWHLDAQGNRVAYISLDATGVLQQGPDHKKTEGKMAWVGCVFNPQPTHEENRHRMKNARYVSGLMSLPEIGFQLRQECQAVDIQDADLVIALTDGGAGLEDCLLDAVAGQMKQLEYILDFFHASEHVHDFAKVFLPGDEKTRKAQADDWCHTLKHEGGRTLLTELESLDLAEARPEVMEAHRLLANYLRNNLHRTDYPRYVKNGWQIGSGVIESACKSVVGGRLKGPGMRWRPYGSTAMCQLRALYKSTDHLWDQYWRTSVS